MGIKCATITPDEQRMDGESQRHGRFTSRIQGGQREETSIVNRFCLLLLALSGSRASARL